MKPLLPSQRIIKGLKTLVLSSCFLFISTVAKSFTILELLLYSVSNCGQPVVFIPDSLYGDLSNVRVAVTVYDGSDFSPVYIDTVTLDDTDYFEYLGNVEFVQSDTTSRWHAFRFIYTDYTPPDITFIELETLYGEQSLSWFYSTYKNCLSCPTCPGRRSMLFTYIFSLQSINAVYPYSGYDGEYSELSSYNKQVIATVMNWFIGNDAPQVEDYENMLNPSLIGQADVPEIFCTGSPAAFNTCPYQTALLEIADDVNEQLIAMGPENGELLYALQSELYEIMFFSCSLSTTYFFSLYSTEDGYRFTAIPYGQSGTPTVIAEVVFDGDEYSAIAYSYNYSSMNGINYLGGGEFEFVNGFKQAVNEEDFLAFPRLTITADGTTTFCQGNSVTLTAQFGSGSFSWSPAGGDTSSITVTDAGAYTVEIEDGDGCFAAADTAIVVTVYPSPTTPEITLSGDSILCKGDSVILKVVSEFTSYYWSNGATSDSITVYQGGAYTVAVADSNSCFSTSEVITIIVNPLPTATITSAELINECNESYLATLTASSGSSYLWNTSETTQSIEVSTEYSYTVIVTDSNGCSATSETTITLR